MSNLEDYMLDGLCTDCDQDPVTCHNANSCLYEEKKSCYSTYPGDCVFTVRKAISTDNYTEIIIVRREVKSLKQILPDGDKEYWLTDIDGMAAGYVKESEMFKTKQEALEHALRKIY